jgi:hypothetical protein
MLGIATVVALGFLAGTSMADNTGTGGVITYTDSNGLNPVASPPYAGGYVVHTFTNSGTLNIPLAASANVLVVAGGGAGRGGNGSSTNSGSGGNGGQLIYSNAYPVSSGDINVTVGAGGVGVSNGTGGTGSNSVFGSLTATGGVGATFGTSSEPGTYGGSGAGGAGAGPGNGAAGNAGGPGLTNGISGTNATYAGGGGGGFSNGGNGGSGGGGHGKSYSGSDGTAGAANTGGGGGGWSSSAAGAGFAGGSGIVIVRYAYGVDLGNTGTGGTITYTDVNGLNPRSLPPYVGGYVVHTFTNSDTFGNATATNVNVLVVAGGGGGGCVGTTGGGGGAGGVTNNTAYAVVADSNYTVTVGAGGLGGKIGTGGRNATSGSNSVFGAITALGGGNGAGNTQNAGTGSGVVGSGGGGAYPGSGGARGTGTPGQGKDGGAGQTASLYGQGGGGGAGSDGQGGSGSYGGTGGDGLYFAAFSSWGDTNNPGYFGGGGGGSYRVGVTAGGLGGKGGGGQGGYAVGLAGQANTGGGGGGGDTGVNVTAGDGGSGIVIVRYPYDSGSLFVTVAAPANGQIFLSGSSVTATVSVASGTAPYSVTFYTNGVSAWSTNNTSATLFSIPLGPLPVGTYTNYATVTDSATPTAATAFSSTNTFTVDGTPPTLAGSAIVDNKGGGPVGRYTPVTYTVTFSEDMDASTVDAADFGNAGSSTITVGSITETSPGVFSVGVTPTSVGTLQLKINAGAVLTDAAGNALGTTSAIPDDTTLTVTVAALTLTWSGTTDMVWTQPDSTSWNDTYYSGDSALFTGSGTGTVTISGTVTPLSVNVSAGNYTFSGGSLTTTGDIYVTSNGSLTLSSDVTVGNTRVFGLGTTTSASTSAMVVVSGVLNVGAGGGAVIIGGGAGTYQSGKGLLVINGGTVNVGAAGTTAQGVDASKLWLNAYGIGGDTGTIDLNGGMLSTARTIENGSIYGNAVVNLNGGTLQAAGAINLIAAAASNRRTTVNVLSGGAIIDTQSFNASISESLRDGGGGGGLTKAGLGTLTLTGTNTYTGATAINAGTLEVSGSLASTNIAVSATTTLVLLNTTCLSTNAVLSYAVGATNTLSYSGTQTVHAIYINGYPKPAGVYHSGNCPVLTGSGWLQTLYSPHPPGTLISFF